MKRLIKIGSKGDTIIEVLLSIAVMSMVLSVSYGLANRSSQSNRQAQERAEAQKIGEEQLELLRGYINEDTQWNNATDVCFTADDTATAEDETGQVTNQNSDCQARGPGGRYNVKITVAGNPAEGYVYTIDTNWENIKGGTDQLALSYKLASTGDIPRTQRFACSDGVNNNDNDTLIDFPADPDCTSPTGNSEDPPPVPIFACGNTIDDDADGRIDLLDPGCLGDSNRDSEVGLPIAASPNPASHTFPSWHLYNTGGSRPTRSFSFTNNSDDAPLQLTTAAIGGANANAFSIISNGCNNRLLTRGQSCSITVQFFPPSGFANNRHGNAGNKLGTLTVNNSSGVPATTTSFSGMTYSDRMGPGDVVRNGQFLVPYKGASCYVNIESCWSGRSFIAGNGNWILGETYCAWGGWGTPGYGNYPGATAGNSFNMQTDGNFVFYDPWTYRYASWTHGTPNLWLQTQDSGGGVYISNGNVSAPYKWIHHGGTCFAW